MLLSYTGLEWNVWIKEIFLCVQIHSNPTVQLVMRKKESYPETQYIFQQKMNNTNDKTWITLNDIFFGGEYR